MEQRHQSNPVVDFIVIGQMRAGTTLLYHYLKSHPSIFMPELKEPRYFNHLLEDPKRPSMIPKGLPITFAEYENLYSTALPNQILGEASPQYINSHVAARQIKNQYPDVKIIASLRDPATRLYSMWIKGLPDPSQPFIDFFYAHEDKWFVQSNFTYPNMQRYFDQFERTKIKVVRFEDLTGQRELVMGDIFQFLRVEKQLVDFSQEIRNEGGVPDSIFIERVFRKISGRGKWGAMIRKFAPTELLKLAKQARAANMSAPPKLSDADRLEVNNYFREDTMRLQDLLGFDLPAWLDNNSSVEN